MKTLISKLVLCIGLIFTFNYSYSHIRVDYEYSITTMCINGASVNLGYINIIEQSKSDIPNGTGTFVYIIKLPLGFKFDDDIAMVSVTYSKAVEDECVVEEDSYEISSDNTKFMFKYTMHKTETELGFFTIDGLKVRAVDEINYYGEIYRTDDASGFNDLEDEIADGTVFHPQMDLAGNAPGKLVHGVLNAWKPDAQLSANKTITGNSISICEDESVTFTAFPVPGSTYRFFVNGSEEASGASNKFTTNNLNHGDKVKVEVTQYTCIAESQEITVNVASKPSTPGNYTGKSYFTTKDPSYSLFDNNSISPSGGQFSGLGVHNNIFYPKTFIESGITSTIIQYCVKGEGACASFEACRDITIDIADTYSAGDFFVPEGVMPFCESSTLEHIKVIIPSGYELVSLTSTTYPNAISNTPTSSTSDTAKFAVYPYLGKNPQNKIPISVLFRSTTKPSVTLEEEGNILLQPTSTAFIEGISPLYCSNDQDTVFFKVIPAGGTFFSYEYDCINGGSCNLEYRDFVHKVNDSISYFLPSTMSTTGYNGFKRLFYNAPGCVVSTYKTFKLLQAPEAKISILNSLPICLGDTVHIRDSSIYAEAPQYKWDFGNNISSNDKDTIIKHLYTKPGIYTLTLTVSDSTTCSDTDSLEIYLGAIAKADFSWKNICLSGSTEFENLSTTSDIVDPIKGYFWDFGDTADDDTSIVENPIYSYSNHGVYDVSLRIENESGCSHQTTQKVTIFKKIDITSTNFYTESFDNPATLNDWVSSSENLTGMNSSWRIETPAGANINDSRFANAWITNNGSNTYNPLERSYVESPCFNIKDLSLPMISLKKWSNVQEGVDGAILQYTIDDGSINTSELVWNTVGNIGDGENWYDFNGITSNPGDQTSIKKIGWSDYEQNKWLLARVALDSVKAQLPPSGNAFVRFRIAFSSDDKNPGEGIYNGFAFDDIFIGQRKKLVILEHFTNMSDPKSESTDNYIQDFFKNNPEQVIALYHHTNFPGIDIINQSNTADPSARALLYGISNVPSTVLDGIFNEKIPFNEPASNPWGPYIYLKRSLSPSAFNIDLDVSVNEGIDLNFKAKKIPTEDTITGPFVIQLAIIKDTVMVGSDIHYNVVKKLVPNAAGTRIVKWEVGDSINIIKTWNPVNLNDTSGYMAVAFIQDENTKEIYQATSVYIPGTTLELLPPPAAPLNGGRAGEAIINTLSLYPNPTNGNIYLEFDDVLPAGYTWQILDIYGRKIDAGVFATSADTYILSTEGYQEGMYTLQIGNRDSVLLTKKVSVIK